MPGSSSPTAFATRCGARRPTNRSLGRLQLFGHAGKSPRLSMPVPRVTSTLLIDAVSGA